LTGIPKNSERTTRRSNSLSLIPFTILKILNT
jgi:hypothetical protein